MTSPSIQVSLDSNVQRVEDPVEEPNTEEDLKCVNGTLELKGTYQVHSKEAYHLLSGCQRVIAEDANLELFAPLVFKSPSLEFEGHLTVVAKAPMAGSCLRVLGQVVISGDFFVKDCQNQRSKKEKSMSDFFLDDPEDDLNMDDAYDGGGIYASNMIQKSGQISIENCSSKSKGGAIYVENSFIQEGGDLMIENCSAGGDGGALSAERSFRQTGGSISLSNCRAKDSGGGLYTRDFEQLGGRMRIQSCKAKEQGGGLSIFGKIFRQDGELHFQMCSAPNGGALYLSSDKVEQGKFATALVEARQLEEKCLSPISGPHTHNLPHTNTHSCPVSLRGLRMAAPCDAYFKKGC